MKRKSAALALAVVILSVTAVQAVPTTYVYTGNPFTFVSGPYSTSDFVTAMVTLANPLPPNEPLTQVTPLAFSLFDGVQTITNLNATIFAFHFATDGDGTITHWALSAYTGPQNAPNGTIYTFNAPFTPADRVTDFGSFPLDVEVGGNFDSPGHWEIGAVPDAASTLSLLSLSLTALGVAARQFKRAAA